jgi:hypothetical protein
MKKRTRGNVHDLHSHEVLKAEKMRRSRSSWLTQFGIERHFRSRHLKHTQRIGSNEAVVQKYRNKVESSQLHYFLAAGAALPLDAAGFMPGLFLV